MNEIAWLLAGTALGGVSAVAMATWAYLERRKSLAAEVEIRALSERATQAETRLAIAEQRAAENAELLRGQAAQSANLVADEMIKRANATFEAQEQLVKQRLEAQLKPVNETFEKLTAHIGELEKQRIDDAASLKSQIGALLTATSSARDEAAKLSNAFRRAPGVQGNWGEQMLRNVLEMSGLRSGIDFKEQEYISHEDGAARADVVVRLPGGGVFVIDSKVSLDDYRAGLDAEDEAVREAHLKAHADSVRRHVTSLSSRAYWAKFDRSPDVVVMFMPVESAFSCVAERHPSLVSDAWEKRVAIVTPMAMFPLLKAVAYGWRAEDQAANAREIAAAGRELHKRVYAVAQHVLNLGGALDRAVRYYNDFIGSMDRFVLTQAKRFETLSAHSDRTLPDLPPLESRSNPPMKLVVSKSDKPASKSDDQPSLILESRAPTSAA
jgi:DNA recombination protein RmuC